MRDIDISLRQACLVGASVVGIGMAARIIYRWKLANDNGFNYRDEVAFVKSCRNNALANAGIGHHTDPFNEFSYESTEFEWDLSNWIKTSAKVEQDPENIKEYILREYTALVKTSDEIKINEIIKNFYNDNRRDFENGLKNETIFKHFVFYVYREYPREKFRMLEAMQDYTGREVKEDSCLDEPEAEKVDVEGSKRRTELNNLYIQLVGTIQKVEPVYNVFENLTQKVTPLQKFNETAKKLIAILNNVKGDLEELEHNIGSADEEYGERLKEYMQKNIAQFDNQMVFCLKEIDKANKILKNEKPQTTRKEVKPNPENKGGNTNDLLKNLKPIEFDPSKVSAAASQALKDQVNTKEEGVINYVPEEKDAEELMEQFQDIADETKNELDDDEAEILDFIDDNDLEYGNTDGYLALNRLLKSQDVSVSDELCCGLLKNMKNTADNFEFMENGNFILSYKGLDYLKIARAFVYYSFTKEDRNAGVERKRWMKKHGKTIMTLTEDDINELEILYGEKERPLTAVEVVRSIAISVRNAITRDIHEVEIGNKTIIPKDPDEMLALELGFKFYTSPNTIVSEMETLIGNLNKARAEFLAKDGDKKELKLVTTDANGRQILNTECRENILNTLTFVLKHRMLTGFIVDRCVDIPDKEAKKNYEKTWGTTERQVHEITVKED